MILFKEEQNDSKKSNDLDFQFYTEVNNLSAVEHLPKGFWEKLMDGIKNVFYRAK